MRLAVVDVVTWTMSDPIQIVEDPDVLLDNFQEYSPNLPQNYDSAMLFTYVILNRNSYILNVPIGCYT